MAKKKFYAIKKGCAPGIYTSWPEAEAQVKGYPGAKYKGFSSKEDAELWLRDELTVPLRANKESSPDPIDSIALVNDSDVVIYTDGGALGNPGPGGYGAVLRSGEKEKELSGGYRLTTNNRMELMACISALREIKEKSKKITLFSDSTYVVNGISKGWAKKWKRNGWLKSDKKPVINQDLWAELLKLYESLNVQFRWVRGHAGNAWNERCDRLAVASAKGPDLQVDRGYELTLDT